MRKALFLTLALLPGIVAQTHARDEAADALTAGGATEIPAGVAVPGETALYPEDTAQLQETGLLESGPDTEYLPAGDSAAGDNADTTLDYQSILDGNYEAGAGIDTPVPDPESVLYSNETNTVEDYPQDSTADVVAEKNTGTVPPDTGREDRIRSIIILTASIILILALAIIIFMLIRRGREIKSVSTQDYIAEAYLNDIHGLTQESSYKLGQKPAMIGRVAGRDSEFLDYVVIPETTIGRRHALIEFKDYGYWIMDQGSINGTFVNDKLVTSETRLKHGDRIRLHKFEFEFVMPDMAGDGATVISSAAASGIVDGAEASTGGREIQPGDEFFDISGGLDQASASVSDNNTAEPADPQEEGEEETLMPGPGSVIDSTVDAEDETLMPTGAETDGNGYTPDEETLLPSNEEYSAAEPAPALDTGAGSKESNEDDAEETLLPADTGGAEPGGQNRNDNEAGPTEEKDMENFVDLFDDEDKKEQS